MNQRIIKICAITFFLAMIYLYFSSPSGIVVGVDGNIKGLANNIRANIQGKSFWKSQLVEINEDLQYQLSEPQRQTQFQRELDQMQREADQSLEEIYRQNPELRPSPAERQAEALREMADQIEQREIDRQLEAMRLERISELRKTLSIVKTEIEK